MWTCKQTLIFKRRHPDVFWEKMSWYLGLNMFQPKKERHTWREHQTSGNCWIWVMDRRWFVTWVSTFFNVWTFRLMKSFKVVSTSGIIISDLVLGKRTTPASSPSFGTFSSIFLECFPQILHDWLLLTFRPVPMSPSHIGFTPPAALLSY